MSNVPNNVIILDDIPNLVNVTQEGVNQVNVHEDTPNTVVVNQDAPNNVSVRLAAMGGNARRHVHTQQAASSTWVINHTLGGKPSVTVVDSAQTNVTGEVQYTGSTDSQVTVFFTTPFSGYAYLT